MIAISALSTITNIIIGSATTKVFDSLVSSKITKKREKEKWLREKRLNLCTELSEVILDINANNIDNKIKNLNKIASKIMLLIEDLNVKSNLKDYLFILNEYKYHENDINISHLNDELLFILCSHMKRL